MIETLKSLFIIEAIILSFQVITYFGCELLQHNPHNVKRAIDERVPLRPAWVYIYVMWFPLILMFPMALYFCSEKIYIVYTIAIITDIVVSTIIYTLYPTSFERKKPERGFFGDSLKFIYFFSFKGYNCAPSMHCSMCFIVAYIAFICPVLPIVAKILIILLTCLIVAATQLTKQHVLIDAVSAIPIAIASIAMGYYLNSYIGTGVLITFLGL